MNVKKILTIVLAVVGVVSAGLLFKIIGTGDTAIEAGEASGVVDAFMNIAYIVFFVTVAIVLVFVLKGLFSGNIKKTLLTVGLFAAIVIISFALSSGTDLDLTQFTKKGDDITEAISKNVGAGLITFYILGVLAIASMLFGSVKKLINK